ncbi:phage baseplate protein [Dryocola sp. BD626]|uniref:phage baseplate protein n=1 Tax=Dryocola sp. BD626 TaxID=3133273 RepID=UPI003F50D1B9
MATDVLGFLWNSSGDSTFRLNDPGVGNLEFDTLDQETHEWKRDVTMNPVENGSPISDHIIRQPKKITVAGMISNAPITGVLTQASNAIATGFDGEDRVNTAIKQLDSLYLSNELVTIYTKNYTYVNMLILDINIPRRVEDGDAINFTIDAVQSDIVSTATTEIPPGVGVRKTDAGKPSTSNSTDSATANRATPTKNVGKNTGSILSQAADGLSASGSRLNDYLRKIIGNVTP